MAPSKNKKGRKTSTASNSWRLKVRDYYSEKRGVLRISFFLSLLILFLMVFSTTDIFLDVRKPFTTFFAWISSSLLFIFGFGTSLNETVIFSEQFAVDIKQGCDAIAPIFLYAATILAFPATWMWKVKGLICGLLALIVLNVIRIISLYLSGVYFPEIFAFLHYEFWQVIFVIFALGIWIYWYNQIQNSEQKIAD